MPVDEGPVTKPVGIALVYTPFTDVRVEVLILVKLNRDSVKPLQVHFTHTAVKHKPVI
jgi:hypothetical protein